jgi:RNA polymerase sigma-70 factor (ECF subfamily)
MAKRTNGFQELTEDIIQESYLRALDSWNRKTIPDSPLAWLKRVARNILIDYLRQKRRHKKMGLDMEYGTKSQASQNQFKSLETFLAISSLGKKKPEFSSLSITMG